MDGVNPSPLPSWIVELYEPVVTGLFIRFWKFAEYPNPEYIILLAPSSCYNPLLSIAKLPEAPITE